MRSIFLFLLMGTLWLTNCKSDSDNRDEDKAADQIEEAADDVAESAEDVADKVKNMFEGSEDAKDIKLVEIAALKDLLPEELEGMDRERIEGEGVGALGFKMNQAEAEYEKGDKRLEIHLIDFGGFGPALVALASWSITNIYHEDEDGYEKVTEWKGYKIFEKSNTRDKSSSVSLIYKNRMIVNAEADEISIADLKELLEDEILDELDDLNIKDPKK